MIESIIVLGKVAVVCGVGFAVATGFEWFSDMEVKPRNKLIKLGSGETREVSSNDVKIDNLRKKIRQQD